MKIKIGYSMGYAGTEQEWQEEVPDEIVEQGREAVQDYLDSAIDILFETACKNISTWGKIVED